MRSGRRRDIGMRPVRRGAIERRHWVGLLVAFLLPVVAALSGVVSVSVPDATVADVEDRPSPSDPGPVMHSGADGLTFSTSGTNQELAWHAELVAVTNNASRSSAVIQGTEHVFLDWFYAKQDTGSRYVSLNATGTYDPNGRAYSVPLLFTKTSQGTLRLTSYDGSNPTTPVTRTYYWAYDGVLNDYLFGTTKDLTRATKVDSVSNLLGTNFKLTLETNTFVVTANAGAPYFVPTITQGAHFSLLGLPASKTWYLMMDPPHGVHEDTYGFTLRVTGTGT